MKGSHIAAKERCARKMPSQWKLLLNQSSDRLPTGQFGVNRFPTLDPGIQTAVSLDQQELKNHGKVGDPVTPNWEHFQALPQFKDGSAFHSVATWSRFDMKFQGVSFLTIADPAKPLPSAPHVHFKAYDGNTTGNPPDATMDDQAMIGYPWIGQPLAKEHGGPARVIVPKRCAWKGAQWAREIVFVDCDLLGFWELRVYSKSAVPVREDRFA